MGWDDGLGAIRSLWVLRRVGRPCWDWVKGSGKYAEVYLVSSGEDVEGVEGPESI